MPVPGPPSACAMPMGYTADPPRLYQMVVFAPTASVTTELSGSRAFACTRFAKLCIGLFGPAQRHPLTEDNLGAAPGANVGEAHAASGSNMAGLSAEQRRPVQSPILQ